MITETILTVFNNVIEFILSGLPNIPEMPIGIQSGIDTITDLITDTIGVMSYIYTPVMMVFVFTLFVAVLAFDNLYKLALWVLHKIRG